MRGDEWGRLCHCIFLGICIIMGLCFITNCASHKYQGCKHFEFGARWRFSNGFDDFYIWPTKSVSTVVPVGLQSGAYAMLKSLDTSSNSCPSLHVATAVYTRIWLYDLLHHTGVSKRIHAVNVLWCIAIVYSTMAIKQHVFLDVLGGVLLALCFAWRWRLARVLSINFK